ncbi:acetyl-CoA C-acyltransferase [Pontivivens insulae]|uniref:acetyl-CoA C-acyltransferase n=1 Tax=Pontivivens insulae TaxID=1639689 RepID=A0A2R8AE04_9RHOB|nr:acetyl-CoA C-acyltransferase [Pontivivens insulae]RED14414.1 acetyl-CoA C-acetyltransferase [Pontivivens insulae]SPF30491.1 3-ketoacyl-CoA thiolase [Pontivivens insulae]
MREAVIVSSARSGLTKAGRGEFNNTTGATLGGHVIAETVSRSGIDPARIEDCLIGCAYPQGTTGGNIARQIVIRAGLPVSIAGATVNRFCSSGLQTVAMAANSIVNEGCEAVVAGGIEMVSQIGNARAGKLDQDPWLLEHKPEIFLPMIDTADIVAQRYGVSRERQDEYGLRSQQLYAAAVEAGKFDEEIMSINTEMMVQDRETKEISMHAVTVDRDTCNRPQTTLDGLAALQPVRGEGNFITAGNASQLSDGAAGVMLMEAEAAKADGIEALATFRGFAVAGCEPNEMGIGPIYAVPKLLERAGMTVDDIDLWELNEAFASQVLYSADTLGIDYDKLNVNGGSIAIGHPFGMTGARQVGHIIREGKRRGAKWGVVTMCIGGGQGAAGLIEIH